MIVIMPKERRDVDTTMRLSSLLLKNDLLAESLFHVFDQESTIITVIFVILINITIVITQDKSGRIDFYEFMMVSGSKEDADKKTVVGENKANSRDSF